MYEDSYGRSALQQSPGLTIHRMLMTWHGATATVTYSFIYKEPGDAVMIVLNSLECDKALTDACFLLYSCCRDLSGQDSICCPCYRSKLWRNLAPIKISAVFP